MISAYAVTVPGELDNVDFTREDGTSVTMLIPPDIPVSTRTIIIPQGFTREETRTIQGAIVQALAGRRRRYDPRETPKPLLWVDVETTGLDANMCSILEIGLRCTSMDAMHEYGRFEAVVHIGRETLLTVQPSRPGTASEQRSARPMRILRPAGQLTQGHRRTGPPVHPRHGHHVRPARGGNEHRPFRPAHGRTLLHDGIRRTAALPHAGRHRTAPRSQKPAAKTHTSTA